MLLGILSDTHDALERTRRAVALLVARGADALVHCGDFVEPEVLAACAVRPLYFVFGNNDSVSHLHTTGKFLKATCLEWGGVIELAGKRIAVAHGHMRFRPDPPADYYLSGHSHAAHDVREGACRFINPGALYRAAEHTVALLNLKTDELEFLRVT